MCTAHLAVLTALRGVYEPTRDTIDAIRPYPTKGSVLAFDELAHVK